MKPVLRSISPEATPEEVAAVVAAIGALTTAPAAASVADDDPDRLDGWVRMSRLSAHRAGLQRGSWRMYGRIGRRARA